MKTRILAILIVLMLVASARAGRWGFQLYGNGTAYPKGDNGDAYYYVEPVSFTLTTTASGWGHNENGCDDGGNAHAYCFVNFIWHAGDPNDPNYCPSPKGGKLYIELTADLDSDCFGGIYGSGNGYVSGAASLQAKVSGDVPNWTINTYAHGSDNLVGLGGADAWFSPWEELDEEGCGEYWSYVTEYEEERVDAFIVEMDGNYSRTNSYTVNPNVTQFCIRYDCYAYANAFIEESGPPQTHVEADASINVHGNVSFFPYAPDYVSN